MTDRTKLLNAFRDLGFDVAASDPLDPFLWKVADRIEQDAATITAMKATMRALLAQLEGYPVKHRQQAQEREVARWLVDPAKTDSEDRKGST